MADPVKHRHVLGLDLIRLLAALLVMAYHFAFWHWTRGQNILTDAFGVISTVGRPLNFGWIGVEIFFVLSGYVIAFSAVGTRSPVFLRNRFLRLAPGSWICASIAFLLYWSVLKKPPGQLLPDYAATLLFWPFRAIDGVYWTLGIEVDFYLLVYCLLRLGRLGTIERLMGTVGVMSGLFWLVALAMADALDGAQGWLSTLHVLVLKAEGNRYLQLILVQHGCLFGLGVVMFRASTSGLTRRRLGLLAVLVGACAIEIIGQTTIIARASATDLSPLPALVTWVAAMAAMTLCIIYNARLAAGLARFGGIIRFAGLMTYPLYLVHDSIGLAVTVLLAPVLGFYALLVAAVAALCGAGLIAGLAEPGLRHLLSIAWPKVQEPVTLSVGLDGDRTARHAP